MPFENGEIPEEELVRVDGFTIWKPTSIAYRRLKFALRGQLHIAAPDGAYRTRQDSQDLIDHPAEHGVRPGVTLRPANQATHGTGLCVDIIANPSLRVVDLRATAARYGFAANLVPNDPNHFQHDGFTSVYTRAHSLAIVRSRFSEAKQPLRPASEVLWVRRIVRDSRQVAVLEAKLGVA